PPTSARRRSWEPSRWCWPRRGLPEYATASPGLPALHWETQPEVQLRIARKGRAHPMDETRAVKPLRGGPGSNAELSSSLPTVLERVRERTPARILTGRAGAAYRTSTYLELRRDHAAARDAVRAELDLTGDLGATFVAGWGLFEVATLARTRDEFLLRPDLGRSRDPAARDRLAGRCKGGADLQVAIADGLSATAVRTQVPTLLPLLDSEARKRGWRFGQPFVIRHGRVGVLNDIGQILD